MSAKAISTRSMFAVFRKRDFTLLWLAQLVSTAGSALTDHRPHRSLPHRATPATIYNTRPKAGPASHDIDTESRVRNDRVSAGAVTLNRPGFCIRSPSILEGSGQCRGCSSTRSSLRIRR